MKIKPFKYAGTPEQIAKLVAWLKGKGVEEEDCSKIGQPPYTCIFCEGATYQLCSHMKTYKRDQYSTLPPEYELEIFGTTNGITGKPESEWFLNEGNNPFQENFNREIQLTLRSGEEVDGKANYGWDWIMRDSTSDIIRWRYAEKSDEEYFVQPETPDKASKFAVKLDLPNGRQPIKPSVRVVNYTNSTEYQDEEINVSDYENSTSNKPNGPIKSDGGSSDYYKLTIKTKNGTFECETGDVIAAMVGDNFALGNALKALRRIWCAHEGRGKEGIDQEYDYNKILFFVRNFIDRQVWK